VLGARVAFTALVMAIVVWLLTSGRPFGGLLVVPLAAIWIRRAVESGRLKLP
jgi:hypothetical protein